ncbi:MAG: hypothetical protein ACE5FG_03730 [Myxococcota bacterium]
MIQTRGAPYPQGWQQGEALRPSIQSALTLPRSGLEWGGWRSAARALGPGPARSIACFLPQQHERLQGIAAGARVRLRDLVLLEGLERVRGVAAACAGELRACFELTGIQTAARGLRSSVPDAGGVPSVELAAAPWAGCLGGVNAEGVAVLCLEDRAWRRPSLRLLAQDLLLRARALPAALDHLRRRAAYLRSSGTLLLASDGEPARRAELRDGELELRIEPARSVSGSLGPGAWELRIALRERRLLWVDGAGVEHAGTPETA